MRIGGRKAPLKSILVARLLHPYYSIQSSQLFSKKTSRVYYFLEKYFSRRLSWFATFRKKTSRVYYFLEKYFSRRWNQPLNYLFLEIVERTEKTCIYKFTTYIQSYNYAILIRQYILNCFQCIDKSPIVEYPGPRFVWPEVFFHNLLILCIIHLFV